MEITNINMLNRPSHITTTVEKIENCLKELKSNIKEFEKSVYGRGYMMNCSNEERREFVENILEMIHNSDYIRKYKRTKLL